ncbi:MAG TPA: zf-HC2 domain-containing protein [Actinomycetota bacterium]|nr:zf-HC2 domain-containing protein [Actinomycetota bacterium]
MACIEFVEVVTDYLEDAMTSAEAARLEAHIADCHGCTAYLEQMRRTARLVGRITVEDIPAAGRDQLLAAFRAWQAGRA